MSGPGIDYGLGRTNVDRATGIRYGVISQHSVGQAWYDSAEADYGEPTCPECGNDAQELSAIVADIEGWDTADHECSDFACERCQHIFGAESAYGDEPLGYSYSGEGYELTNCLDSDIMVLQSPFYTIGAYCSPCVPGAVSLDSPMAPKPIAWAMTGLREARRPILFAVSRQDWRSRHEATKGNL